MLAPVRHHIGLHRFQVINNAKQYDWAVMGAVYDDVLSALHKDVAVRKRRLCSNSVVNLWQLYSNFCSNSVATTTL